MMFGLIPFCLILTSAHTYIHLSLLLPTNLAFNYGIPLAGQGSVLRPLVLLLYTYFTPDPNQSINLE